jgi:protein-tyrosine phosphatase
MSFAVLFVCTGNVCRSPIAEKLLRGRLPATAPVVSASAGVRALSGRPIDPPSAQVLRELGGDPSAHVARRLTDQHIAAADLILTADVSQRAMVLKLEPLAFRRAFTLREFGRLATGLDPSTDSPTEVDLRARVEEVARQRGLLVTVRPDADDISDPFGRGNGAARVAGREISAGIDALIAVLGLSRADASAR